MRQNAFVYVMAHEGLVKVGHSTNPVARAKSLGLDPSVVEFARFEIQAERIERMAHALLTESGYHDNLEWVACSVDEACRALSIARVRVAENRARPKRPVSSVPQPAPPPPLEQPSPWYIPEDIGRMLDERIKARSSRFADRVVLLRAIVVDWVERDRRKEKASIAERPYIPKPETYDPAEYVMHKYRNWWTPPELPIVQLKPPEAKTYASFDKQLDDEIPF